MFFSSSVMDARRRQHPEQCCGMGVEKSCYVFAIINVVLVCLSCFGCLVTLVFLLTKVAVSCFHVTVFEHDYKLQVYFVYAVVCVVTAIYGVFAVLLLQGIRKKKPKLILAYLYFGLILEVTLLIITTAYPGIIIVATIRDARPDHTLIYSSLALAICICVLYGFILYLVRSTYQVILARSRQNFVDENTVLQVYEQHLRS